MAVIYPFLQALMRWSSETIQTGFRYSGTGSSRFHRYVLAMMHSDITDCTISAPPSCCADESLYVGKEFASEGVVYIEQTGAS